MFWPQKKVLMCSKWSQITSRMLCASNPGKDSCQGESGGDDDHEEKKDKRQRRGKYDGNNRYRYIDLQQVYLLQSEALKYLLSCLFANTFAITAVSSTDIICY